MGFLLRNTVLIFMQALCDWGAAGEGKRGKTKLEIPSYSPEILEICSTMPLSSFRKEKAVPIITLELTSCSWAEPEDMVRLQSVLSWEIIGIITSLVLKDLLPPPSPSWTQHSIQHQLGNVNSSCSVWCKPACARLGCWDTETPAWPGSGTSNIQY